MEQAAKERKLKEFKDHVAPEDLIKKLQHAEDMVSHLRNENQIQSGELAKLRDGCISIIHIKSIFSI